MVNPAYAAEYINAVLIDIETGDADIGTLLIALKDVVDALGVSLVARTAEINRQHIYDALSKDGNPTINTLTLILQAVGLRITVEPSQAA